MRTKAQIYTPMEVYGKQTHRGNIGENHAAKDLRNQGYHVSHSPSHPHGYDDLIAVKGKTTRRIQVKRISSRSFRTAETARKRMAGKPFNIKKVKPGHELWVYDKQNRLFVFKK